MPISRCSDVTPPPNYFGSSCRATQLPDGIFAKVQSTTFLSQQMERIWLLLEEMVTICTDRYSLDLVYLSFSSLLILIDIDYSYQVPLQVT